MANGLTRDGRGWTPAYLDTIDPNLCIGCGRCYKVCGRGVMEPIAQAWDDDDDDEGVAATVMSVVDNGACIGCEACAKVCVKKAHRHVAA